MHNRRITPVYSTALSKAGAGTTAAPGNRAAGQFTRHFFHSGDRCVTAAISALISDVLGLRNRIADRLRMAKNGRRTIPAHLM
jgi:hypothetical protein